MTKGLWIFVWLTLWYSVVAFWGWTLIHSIKIGDAGSSGMKLKREEEPIRFWLTVGWDLFWLVVFVVLPIAVLLKKEYE